MRGYGNTFEEGCKNGSRGWEGTILGFLAVIGYFGLAAMFPKGGFEGAEPH